MERARFHAPLVVENRPFILDAQKSGRDLQRCLGWVCNPHNASTRKWGLARKGWRGKAGGRSEDGAEPQVNGNKGAFLDTRWKSKKGLALVKFLCRHRALLLFLAGKVTSFYRLPRLVPRFITPGQSISNSDFGTFPALGSAPVFWTARGFWV